VVLEKDGGDELDQSFEKWWSDTKIPGEEEYPTNNKQNKGCIYWLYVSWVGTAT
jgi:hypothetical protein